MGRFFACIQIYNSHKIARENIIEEFIKIINSNGYCPSNQEDFVISYALAFSANNRWITVGSNDYKDNSSHSYKDAQQIAMFMETSSFCMEVVDSDFADIKLYNKSGHSDTVIVGRSYFSEEESPKGKSECWKHLLIEGKTWNDLSIVWNKEEVFVEDALCEAADLLGIDQNYMLSDYDDLKNNTENDNNILLLYFKKTNC
ncbi:hypothetical protein M9Y10_042235 [Tritrichomonas musculus]|uniref:Uncharacterized protein n=1 Tax=Tritrichomonas musculus TaxID=1915356 RepID=A0ABR2K6L7_9EUKA